MVIEGVSLNPGRIGFYQVLRNMGARVTMTQRQAEPEPIGDIQIGWSPLHGIRIDSEMVPGLIDELPLIALLAAHAEGATLVSGAGELRVKESDRIRATVDNLQGLGIAIEERPDGFLVAGDQRVGEGVVDARGDHRIAMMLAVAGAVAKGPVMLEGSDAIEISYPNFFHD
jgi:3-phosphoshikimate 1-carboxyvinyltransferase